MINLILLLLIIVSTLIVNTTSTPPVRLVCNILLGIAALALAAYTFGWVSINIK
jgi:hypothetical protein